ncbi:hypothetical protein ACFXCU_37400, partial [Streptomyces virginiae]|uniref:hypothetical protein n=1 Tax=Streptomyces virginiae TaxID=1961 RepID=UPI00368E342C
MARTHRAIVRPRGAARTGRVPPVRAADPPALAPGPAEGDPGQYECQPAQLPARQHRAGDH